MTTAAIVQARMGSTRLPGKVLIDVAGKSLLAWCVDRATGARELDAVIVATTDRAADDAIAAHAKAHGWPCHRGSERDVLRRYLEAADAFAVDTIVRLTSDCPLIDAGIIDAVVAARRAADADYASNTLRRTYPRGLDVEAVTRDALGAAADEADDADREHVTRGVWRRPDRFRLASVEDARDHSSHRWTVDTPEDLELVRRILTALPSPASDWHTVLAIVEAHPDWPGLNAHVKQKQP